MHLQSLHFYLCTARMFAGHHRQHHIYQLYHNKYHIQQHHNQQNIHHQHHQHHIGRHHHYQPEWDPNDPYSRTSEVGNAIGQCNENKYICAPALPLSIVKNKSK